MDSIASFTLLMFKCIGQGRSFSHELKVLTLKEVYHIGQLYKGMVFPGLQ
jgi:hypothetical protein